MGRNANYLYQRNENDAKSNEGGVSSSHVHEYLIPIDPNSGHAIFNKALLHPDFLYASPKFRYIPPPRVVEFYAPWCSHCQHYAPHYMELANEVYAIEPSIVFHAVSCVPHHELCEAQNITSHPMIKLYKEGSYDGQKCKQAKMNVKTILKELGFDNVDGDIHDTGDVENGQKRKTSKKETARVVPFQVYDVHDAWADAALSFEFALHNSIYVENGPLNVAKSKAFREWVTLLSNTLPPQMTRTHEILNSLITNFDKASGGQSEINDLVKQCVGPVEPSWTWRTCTYGDGRAVGYTCGLWQLFHIMSIGVVEYNQNNSNNNLPAMPTRYVADILRDYIDYFFQCEVCRLNFLSMYDTCAFDGCNRLLDRPSLSDKEWHELPLWLWETHNDVNVRLMNERNTADSKDPSTTWESQQARWPSLYSCPDCWRDEIGTKSWDEEEVYKYLRNTYWTGNPSYLHIPPAAALMNDRSRLIPLRWKLAVVVILFAAVAMLRLYNSKKSKRPEYKK